MAKSGLTNMGFGNILVAKNLGLIMQPCLFSSCCFLFALVWEIVWDPQLPVTEAGPWRKDWTHWRVTPFGVAQLPTPGIISLQYFSQFDLGRHGLEDGGNPQFPPKEWVVSPKRMGGRENSWGYLGPTSTATLLAKIRSRSPSWRFLATLKAM